MDSVSVTQKAEQSGHSSFISGAEYTKMQTCRQGASCPYEYTKFIFNNCQLMYIKQKTFNNHWILTRQYFDKSFMWATQETANIPRDTSTFRVGSG